MVIRNPGIVLPLGLAILLVGVGVCVYVLARFLMGLGGAKSKPERLPAARQSRWQQVKRWLSHPATGGGGGRLGPDSSRRVADAATSTSTTEVMRVFRVGSAAELVVEAEGRLYRKITEIQDGEVGRRVLMAIMELADFADPFGLRVWQDPTISSNGAVPMVRRETGPVSVQIPQLPAGESVHRGNTAVEPDSDEPRREARLSGRRRREERPAEPAGFLEQLDDMLQAELAVHPSMAGRSVRLCGAASGELRIEVDDRLYGAVDEIPDPEVVSLIRATLRAWETT